MEPHVLMLDRVGSGCSIYSSVQRSDGTDEKRDPIPMHAVEGVSYRLIVSCRTLHSTPYANTTTRYSQNETLSFLYRGSGIHPGDFECLSLALLP